MDLATRMDIRRKVPTEEPSVDIEDTSPLLDDSILSFEEEEIESIGEERDYQGTILSSVTNITNTILGSGMVAMVFMR